MGFHHEQQISDGIHLPISYSYADSTARTSATGFVSTDIYKFAVQTDENSVWMLTETTPTWVEVSGFSSARGAGSGLTLNGNDIDLGGTLSGDAILTPDTDGDHTVNLGASTSSRIDTFNAFTENFAGLQAGSLNDRSFVSVFGDLLGGIELGYFQNETDLMGFRINSVKDNNFEVVNEVSNDGIKYTAEPSSPVDLTLAWKGYVDGLVGDGSIYETNGTLSGARTVTGNTGDSLTFEHYNGTSSTYTLRGEVELDDDNVTLLAALGDGFGADLASTSLTLANTGLSIATGVGDTDVFLHGNDWLFYEGSSDTSTNVLTVHGDGDHSAFDPYITLHEGFATGNGTDAQDLVVNFGKGNLVKFNDGTRSVDVFSIKSVVNASQTFTHMEHNYQGVQQDFLNIRSFNWYFDTTGTPLWTIYDDDAGTNTLFTFDDSGDMDVAGDITVNGDGNAPLVPPYATQVRGTTDVSVTTTEQTIPLDATDIDGSGTQYDVNLANNRFDFDGADGSKVFEVSFTGNIQLTNEATTGANRSFCRIKARLDAVDVTGSEAWAYIREWQGGNNGDPSTGIAHGGFLIQPAVDDELDFRVYGTTDTGQTLTDHTLVDFCVTIKRVA